MAITPLFNVYLNAANPAIPLLLSPSSSAPAGSLQVVDGDKVTLRLYFVTATGAIPTYDLPAQSGSIIFAAKKNPSDADLVYFLDSWTFGATYIEGTLDLATPEGFWTASEPNKSIFCNVEVRTAANAARLTWSFFCQVVRQSYGGGETPPDPPEPYLDTAAALQIFVAYDRAQSLTTPNKAQARSNIGGTTVGGAFFTLANPSAVRWVRINADNTVTALSAADTATAIGLGAASDVTFGTVKAPNFITGAFGVDRCFMTADDIVGQLANGTETFTIFRTDGSAVFTGGVTTPSIKASGVAGLALRDSAGNIAAVIGGDGSVVPSAGTTLFHSLSVGGVGIDGGAGILTIGGNLELGGDLESPGSAASLANLTTNTLKATTSAGVSLQSNNGTGCASYGAGGGANFTAAALAVTASSFTVGGFTLTPGASITWGSTGRSLSAASTATAANAALYEDFTEYLFNAADMSAATPSGAGYTGLDSVRNEATTYTTTAGVGNAHASFGAFGLRGLVFGGFAISSVPFAKRIEFSGTSSFITGYLGDANSVGRVYIGGRTAAGTGDVTARAIGWRKVGGSANVFLSVHNGTTLTNVDTGFAPTADTAFSWRITSDGSGNVVMFINGTQVATTSAGPSTTGTGGTPPFQSVEGVAGNATRQAIVCTAYRIRIYA